MFNDFLSSLLQIVVVVDVIGVVAYFILSALRPRESDSSPAPTTLEPDPSRPHRWPSIAAFGRLRMGIGRLASRRMGRARVSTDEALEASFARLYRVLNSYHEGLA